MSCRANFPFSASCNGAGLCFSNTNLTSICLCNLGYISDTIDSFSDPTFHRCFLTVELLWWLWVVSLVLISVAFVRLLIIFELWLRTGNRCGFTLETFLNEIENRPRVQLLCGRLFLSGVMFSFFLYKVMSSDLGPVGVDLASTVLFSLCQIIGVAVVNMRNHQVCGFVAH